MFEGAVSLNYSCCAPVTAQPFKLWRHLWNPLLRTNTHSFLAHTSFSKCLRHCKCWEGRGFSRGSQEHLKWGDGKTCPSNVSDRSLRSPNRRLIWHHCVTFHPRFSQEVVLHPSHPICLFVCACLGCVCDRAQSPLGKTVDTWIYTDLPGCCWCVKNGICWLDITVSCGGLGVHFTLSAVTFLSADYTW